MGSIFTIDSGKLKMAHYQFSRGNHISWGRNDPDLKNLDFQNRILENGQPFSRKVEFSQDS